MMSNRVVLALALITLASCSSRPSINKIDAAAKTKIQQQLDADMSADHLQVQKVELVSLGGPKYDGDATLTQGDQAFTTPVSVTSDGVTTIATYDGLKIRASIVALMSKRLSVLTGKYPDYILKPDLFALLPTTLRADKADFTNYMGVMTPVTLENGYYLGSGCKPHDCLDNAAAWSIEQSTGRAVAIIKKTWPPVPGGMTEPSTVFHVYGATADTIPQPLAAWAVDDGMTVMNVSYDSPDYQAPPKS